MKNILLSTVAIFALTSTAHAGVVAGEATVEIAKNNAGDYAGSLGVDLGVSSSVGSVELGFTAVPGGDLNLDTWTVGTIIGAVGLSFGNDNSVFVGAEGEQTIAAPAMAESLKITTGDAAVAVGFTDWDSDITDISNIQGSYELSTALANIKGAVDYNLNSKNLVVGAEVTDIAVGSAVLGATVTYDVDAELAAYEGIAKISSVTAYVNGDQEDFLQNVGGEYVYALGKAEVTSGVVYNFDSEEISPTIGLAFNF
jgi:hypothetical protein